MAIQTILSGSSILGGSVDFSYANTIAVDVNGGGSKFNSIKQAVDAANPTSLTPVVIMVYPGIYAEDPIVMKPYIKIQGMCGELHTTILANDINQPLITASNYSAISGITVRGASNAAGVIFTSTTNDPSGTFTINDTRFMGNLIDFHLYGGTFTDYIRSKNLYFVTINNTVQYHLKIENPGAGPHVSLFHSVACTNLAGIATSLISAIHISDPNAEISIGNLTLNAIGGANASGDGVTIQNGAHVTCVAGSVSNYNNNIVVKNVGAAPAAFIAVNLASHSTVRDVSIEHPGTTGLFSGTADQEKVFVDPASSISISYTDTGVSSGTVLAGELYFGPNQSTVTNATALLNESLATGVLFGGTITQGVNPLDVNISAGYGYISLNNGRIYLKKITWTDSIFSLPDNTNSYIFVNSAGTITTATSEPDIISNIVLGRARTSGGVITFIAKMPRRMDRLTTKLSDFAREAIGPVYKSGSVVTENVTPLHLNVSSGVYYYSDLKFLPSGADNISFYPWYNTTGTWTKGALATAVSNTQYNNVATGLVSLTAGYYTKHILYIGGDGANEQYGLVYGQAEYSTLLLAQGAAITLPPPVFTDIIAPIAAIIVQQGSANIIEFVDIRPRIGFQNPSTSAAATHGNLLGLSADDHPQYLLVNGTRAMSGALNMALNAISNVTTVNGVTVEAHASRHLPNGADAITTAAPLVAISPTTTNSAGTANSLARSDHQHSMVDVARSDSPYVTIGNVATLSGERALTVTANQITLTDGGANGAVTLAIADNVILPGTESVTIPKGLTSARPLVPAAGMLRFDTSVAQTEVHNGAYWSRIGALKKYYTGTIAPANGVTTIPYTTATPLITGGTQIWTQTLTPLSLASQIDINFAFTVDASAGNQYIIIALFRDSTCIYSDVWSTGATGSASLPVSTAISYTDTPGTTSPVVYSARIGITGGTWYINSTLAGATLGGTLASEYRVVEFD